jgi:hypothetical protein
MYQLDEEQIETLHIYLEQEKPPRPSLFPIVVSVLALSLVVAIVAFAPYQQPVTRITLRVPAILLPIRTYTAEAPIIPTGVKTYAATTAHGTLTFSNGSVIGLSIPQGFTVHGAATDSALYVPPATANSLGVSTVPAHLLTAGNNLLALAINEVIGASLFVRNLSPFTGGRDSYSVKVVTPQDKVNALQRARSLLVDKARGLHYPCNEAYRTATNIEVTWSCQFVTYYLPAYMHVSSVRFAGQNLIVAVWFVEHPQRYWVK